VQVTEADISEFLRKRLADAAGMRLIAIYVFGSFARGEMRPDSDIDVAFLHEQTFDPVEVFSLAQQLASHILRDVDLIDLRRAPTVLRAEVVGYGRRIYTGDELRAGEFEMYAFSAYARFNEECREVLESIAARYRASKPPGVPPLTSSS
jgi:predicted nucleotidyltransferase